MEGRDTQIRLHYIEHQVDVVEVVHVWVETLAAQEQLDHMSDAVKLNTPKYLTLFLMWMNYPPVMDP